MKKLLLFLCILPFLVKGQITPVTISTADSSQFKRGTGTTNAEVIIMNGTRNVTGGFLYNRWNGRTVFRIPLIGDISGLQDSLTKKANRTFDNVASGAIANSKLANSTISGISLGSTLNALTAGNGITLPTSYTGATARTLSADTSILQTVLNFFPKGDTRYLKSSTASTTYLPLSGGTLTGALIGTTGKFWDGTQGLIVRSYTAGAGFGAIYSTGVTPGSANYAIASDGATTGLNGTTTTRLDVNGTPVITATATTLTAPALGSSGDVIVGSNNSGLLSKIAIGSGLSLSGGTLTATGGSAGTVTGSGTAGKLTKWNSASDIGDASSLTISGSDLQVAGVVQGTSLTSTVSTGTAPLTVTSTTPVTNLSIGGNAATTTALATARTINGTAFDGTGNITVTAAAGTLTGATLNSGVTASSLTSVGTLTSLGVTGAIDSETRLAVNKPGSNTAAAGPYVRIGSDSNNRYWIGQMNASFNYDNWYYNGTSWVIKNTFGTNGDFTATGAITGSNLSGTNTGDQTSVTGNAGTATALQTARNIAGVAFDGTANISLNNNAITNGAGYITGNQTITLSGAVTGSGAVGIATTLASGIDATKLADGSVTSTELQYINTLTSNAQSQIDLKAPLASPTFTGTVSGITKTMVGLGNVDNTSDASKPVSTATQTALDLKANLASPALTGSPTAPTQSANDNSTKIATTAYVDAATAGSAYSTGSWTPAGNGVTFASASGSYVTIGDMVFATFSIVMPSTANGSTFSISGLPFPPVTSSIYGGNVSVNNTGFQLNPLVGDSGGGYIDFLDNSAGSKSNANVSTKSLSGTVIYKK